jgi:hypothetical protein
MNGGGIFGTTSSPGKNQPDVRHRNSCAHRLRQADNITLCGSV